MLLVLFVLPLSVNAYTPTDTANAIVKSLKTEPEHWIHDQFKLYYFKDLNVLEEVGESSSYREAKADCIIWIANGAYGVEVQSPKKVKLKTKTKEFIWKIYQKWANEYFNEEVFAHLQEPSKIAKEPSPVLEEPSVKIKEEDEFTQLTPTSDIRRDKTSDDFFSSIPDWIKTVAKAFSIAAIFTILVSSIFHIMKKGGYKCSIPFKK